ncbi:MAG: VOC family protein, partial [Planctomycetes bacterium]|nr:VOC family protein [Planctomycetota bacterium]
MSTDQRIDYVEFPSNDFDACEAFYTKTFSWSFTDYGPEYRAFNDGQFNGGFFKSELCSTTASGAALVILYATDLEATQEKVAANGGTICKDI